MNNYSKADIRQDNNKRLAKSDTLYLVCIVYIAVFVLNIVFYFVIPERPAGSFMSYSAAMTGIFCLFAAIVLPFILSWQNKRYTRIYKSEMNK